MARYLPLALDSVLAQTYPSVEAIVVDDGSQDETPAVAAAYSGRITWIRQENQGVAGALNTAVAAAKGTYVRLLAADDLFLPDSTRIEVEFMEANPGLGMVCGQAYGIDSLGRRLPGLIQPLGRNGDVVLESAAAFHWLLKGSHVVCGTVMMRREAILRAGPFQQEAVPGEDWDMFLRIAAFSGIGYIGQPLCSYRIHEESMTAGFNVAKLERSHAYTLQRLYAREDLKYRATRALAYAYNDLNLARLAAYCRDPKAYVRHFGRAIRRSPGLLCRRETGNVVLEGARALVPTRVSRPLKRAVRRSAGFRPSRRGRVERASEELEHV
jgi:glycosyltransferase involved in cell wall biosynthesis